jgi:hypothetical protein
MIVASFGLYPAISGHDHGTAQRELTCSSLPSGHALRGSFFMIAASFGRYVSVPQ